MVQSNYPQTNSGEKGAKIADRLDLHIRQTLAALDKSPGQIDMVVWSETMMEALNATARLEGSDLSGSLRCAEQADDGESCRPADRRGILRRIGTMRCAKMGRTGFPEDRRNTAYFFDAEGRMDDSLGHRYDKIHLVPWGEFIPGKESMPFLYKLSVKLGPKYYSDYIMQPGEILTVFHLQRRRERIGDLSRRSVLRTSTRGYARRCSARRMTRASVPISS